MELTVTATGKTAAEIGKELIATGKLLAGVEVHKEDPKPKNNKKRANGADEEEFDGDDDADAEDDGETDDDADADDDGEEEEKEAAGPSEDQVRGALNKLAKKKGKKAAILILKKYKVESVDDLAEKYYSKVIAATKA